MRILSQSLALFSPAEKVRLGLLFGATVLIAILEMIGVASIMPFMALVANPAVIHENAWTSWAYESFGFTSADGFLFATGVVVLVLMTLSNALGAATTWLTLRFMWLKHHRLTKQLLKRYLYRPYAFYLNQNTARLSKNILAEVSEVVQGVFVPAMQVISRAIVAILLCLLLVFVDPVLAAIVALILGGAYGGLYWRVKARQTRFGRERVNANFLRYKIAGEALVGIKDVKVLGREDHFLAQFDAPSRRVSRLMCLNAVLGQLPRYALETLAFGALLVVMLYLLRTRSSVAEVLPIISLYAFAGYRLMPALQHIFHGMTRIRFNVAALEDLHGALTDGSASVSAGKRSQASQGEHSMELERELVVEALRFRYPNAQTDALCGIDLRVARNTTIGLVGSSGSGKTTLVDIVLGLLEPTSGRVLVDGVAVDSDSLPAWRLQVGYVPQQIFLSDDTITRNIAFGIPDAAIDMEAVARAAAIAELTELIDGLPHGYETIIGERGTRLSGGQRQRIGIARAMYHDPSLLVLDEATSALDGVTEDAVMQSIRTIAAEKTVIVIAHRLSTVRECDRIIMLEGGCVVAEGSYDQLVNGSATFRAMVQASGVRTGVL